MDPSRPSTRNGSRELSKQESGVTAPGTNINTTVDRRFAGCVFSQLPGFVGTTSLSAIPSGPAFLSRAASLIHIATTAGTSRVAYGPLCLHAVANTPAGLMELVRSYRSTNFGLPTKPGRVGSCISLFEACSAFTHVTACTLAKSPSDSLHQRLQQFRCLHYCSDCYRVERTSSRAGLTPAVDHHLSRRTR
jgi:hypothetical protein